MAVPMKSEPPTPTRAPDDQFKKMSDSLDKLETRIYWMFGVGVRGSYSIGEASR